ncbi:uroporphyrinogen-III C-methyltransferase [Pseudorhodoferax sp.]|uniref:uroporphyrinogen-III C-methyltransferase n=1 Tax=Pseudorhodoferax sp. TaxID=1993553 RepID=UPI002DD68BDE|nr:uroporphyrinogen-III C-methyltransferase [Pseudorhodoferax sp.]
MNAELSQEPLPGSAAAGPVSTARPPTGAVPRVLVLFLALLVVVALVAVGLLWQKVGGMQENLARQSSDTQARAMEARAAAREAQDLARETAARLAVTDAKLGEATLQRGQIDELLLSLSRSRDETLVVDLESSVRLAQQQAQLTLSAEPLLAALRTADQRLERAAQPRLEPVRRAIARDTEQIRSTQIADTQGMLEKLDDLVRQIDEVPLLNAVLASRPVQGEATVEPPAEHWWLRAWQLVRAEATRLVRVSRIDQPEAALLAPEQAYFLRENLKLRLLNVRMGLLARQFPSARADAAAAAFALHRYFDPAARRTQQFANTLSEVQAQLKSVELPRVDETLTALATAAAGR